MILQKERLRTKREAERAHGEYLTNNASSMMEVVEAEVTAKDYANMNRLRCEFTSVLGRWSESTLFLSFKTAGFVFQCWTRSSPGRPHQVAQTCQ